MTDPEHGRVPLYVSAQDCDHDEPPEPDAPVEDSDAWSAWDDWHDDHVPGAVEGEPICTLTQAGWCCPACTDEAREEHDLPPGEWVECQLADKGGPKDA